MIANEGIRLSPDRRTRSGFPTRTPQWQPTTSYTARLSPQPDLRLLRVLARDRSAFAPR